MKKVIILLLAMLAPVIILAANTIEPQNITLEMFASVTALAAGIVAITAIFKEFIKTEGIVTDIISWGLGIVLALLGYAFKLGMFETLSWYMAVFYGLLAGFYANKGYDVYTVIKGDKDATYTPND